MSCLLCLTVKLQSSKLITTLYLDFLASNFCCFPKLKRKGVKIISQMKNDVKLITVHVISVLFVDCLQGLFVYRCELRGV